MPLGFFEGFAIVLLALPTGLHPMDTCEKLYSAAVELAGEGSIKQRLVGAYVHHLDSLEDAHMPSEIRDDFSALRRALCSVRPLPGENPVLATVRKMSDGEASRYATQIVSMFSTVTRAQQRRPSGSGQVIQLYAAEG
jgi:hypothetical protein